MNQTKKRLKIITLAISITDIETIQLQIYKLSPLKTDLKIQEIVAGLQAENYAQTQALINTYIETPMEEILQRTSQEAKQLKKSEAKDIIEEFDLFETTPAQTIDAGKEMFDFDSLEPKKTSKIEQKSIDFDTLLNIETKDVLLDNIEPYVNPALKKSFIKKEKEHSESKKESHIDISIIPRDTFFDTEDTPVVQEPEKKEETIAHIKDEELVLPEESTQENHIDTETIARDTFFDTEDTTVVQESEKEEETINQIEDEEIALPEENTQENHIDTETIARDTFFDTEDTPVVQGSEKKEETINQIEDEESIQENHETMTQKMPEAALSTEQVPSQYEAIPYIDQKFKNMHTQYPPVQESDENFSSVQAWLLKISNEGYTHDEIEEVIKHIKKLTETKNLGEAAELLLITGATKSKFAQLILARALYTGEILQKNLPESFTLINRLAIDDNYPEAICDLAQFYEHGIGIGKDKKRAEMLYKEAMDLEITRAMAHYERLRKQNRGFFSAFKK